MLAGNTGECFALLYLMAYALAGRSLSFGLGCNSFCLLHLLVFLNFLALVLCEHGLCYRNSVALGAVGISVAHDVGYSLNPH